MPDTRLLNAVSPVGGSRWFGYVPALDGLRGLAVATVVSYHLWGFPRGGAVGVDLFFALSGFLITTLLIEERGSEGTISLRRFYVRRGRRLLPALAALLIAYLLWNAAHGHNALRPVVLGGIYFSNFVPEFTDPNLYLYTGLSHLWSLAEEEQFYLLWPLALTLLLKTRQPARWTMLILVGLLAYRSGLLLNGAHLNRIYRGPDTHSLGLLGGCLLALRPVRLREWGAKTATLIYGFLTALGPVGVYWWLIGQPLLEAATVALVAAALTAPGFIEAFSVRPLRWLGRISYSLYLWHLPVFWALHHRHPLFALAVSISAACCSYQFIEKPLRHRRRTPDRVGEPLPAPIAAPATGRV